MIEIGTNAFNSCINSKEVGLNGAFKYIQSVAFRGCDALERFLFSTISYRLENIIQTNHWGDLEDKLNEVRGVLQWESNELFVSRGTSFQYWNHVRRDLGRITRLVSYYEQEMNGVDTSGQKKSGRPRTSVSPLASLTMWLPRKSSPFID